MPMPIRIDSDWLATNSPTSGWKNDTAPATAVMNPKAAVLLLNMVFILVCCLEICLAPVGVVGEVLRDWGNFRDRLSLVSQ